MDMNTTDWLLLGLLFVTTGGFLWQRPVIEIPARITVWMIIIGFFLGLLGAAVTELRSRS